ncbi:uncharacterized protein K452DRAFT_337388 [Aplosporella prunicola CBS 121167]|uniref:Heterokaryon incompatibility domain-containing protein n=1 Tax=Aplosporella prunicola CBS 121167 TaxID=1176127 RepID=A0A6A6B7L9_9PEZI|nr:uncharacterized protein K452DRAFT_337388 [Aplosporella prunicola CBS 121167]KAF2139255.1 hypothetical protein K452DRAFT_337388 [Aplosporella prunicola CBS 121167]
MQQRFAKDLIPPINFPDALRPYARFEYAHIVEAANSSLAMPADIQPKPLHSRANDSLQIQPCSACCIATPVSRSLSNWLLIFPHRSSVSMSSNLRSSFPASLRSWDIPSSTQLRPLIGIDLLPHHGDSSQPTCACTAVSVIVINHVAFCEECGLPVTDTQLAIEQLDAQIRSSADDYYELFKYSFANYLSRLPYNLPPYKYIPIQREEEIRLAVLHPGCWKDPIHCTITRAEVDNLPAFEAISYTWADENGDASLSSVVTCGRSRKIIPVTPNCIAALRRIRLLRSNRLIWIDSICIDQNSLGERSHQVRWMSKIYSAAWRVLVYLGEAPYPTWKLFNHLNDIQSALDHSRRDKEGYFKFASFDSQDDDKQEEYTLSTRDLLSRPWFSRTWVLQEICMAQKAKVLCGNRLARWESLSIFNLNCANLGCTRLDGTIPAALLIGKESLNYNLGFAKYRTLLGLLRDCRPCLSTDPHDKVYALLGLVEDDSAADIHPDYSRPISEVFTEVAVKLIKYYNDLRILTDAQGPTQISGLPSWAPDWSSKAVDPISGRRPLGLPDSDSPPIAEVLRTRSLSGSQAFLSIRGTKLGRIFTIGYIYDGKRPVADPYKLRSSYVLSSSYPNQLPRIEFWSHWDELNHSNPPLLDCDIPQAFACTIQSSKMPIEESFGFPSDANNNYSKPCEKEIDDFKTAISSKTKSHRLFATEETMGVGPADTEVGDVVYSLRGADVPFVLRPYEDGFKLVGDCYVHPRKLYCRCMGWETKIPGFEEQILLY